MIESLAIIGSGNAAWQLGHQMIGAGLPLQKIITRNREVGEHLARELKVTWQPMDSPIHEQGVFICVIDQAIEQVSKTLIGDFEWMVHCAGSVPMSALSDHKQRGVFYPIQTMSKGRLVSGEQFPVCLEAENDGLILVLKELALAMGSPYRVLDSERRKKAHVSAVMVNNFVNHLLHKASDFASAHHVDGAMLEPLIRETIDKFFRLGGVHAQTGPAKRGDGPVIAEQEKLLEDQQNLLKLYQIFTESIKYEFGQS